MICAHKHLKCTDNVFFCLDCGVKLEPPAQTEDKPKKKGGKTK